MSLVYFATIFHVNLSETQQPVTNKANLEQCSINTQVNVIICFTTTLSTISHKFTLGPAKFALKNDHIWRVEIKHLLAKNFSCFEATMTFLLLLTGWM